MWGLGKGEVGELVCTVRMPIANYGTNWAVARRAAVTAEPTE